jgi:hypothetical protein
MDTDQLKKICLMDIHLKHIMLGVFACNKLPKNTPRPCCLIANTKPSTHEGEHWIAIFINKEGYGDYFCSYGQLPENVFVSFMQDHCIAWNRTTKVLQQSYSATCGQYALFFLHARANGCSLAKFLDLFTNNHQENDEIVTAFINGLYEQDTQVFDFSLFREQYQFPLT